MRRLDARPASRRARGHLGVGEPRVRAHHRRIERGSARSRRAPTTLMSQTIAQPVDVRVERAQPVRELLRQHRDHAAREVHRVAAVPRFQVERIAVLHVVADVGDRHAQPEAPPFLLAVHGVVEVLRGLAVDRHERERAQVGAARAVCRPHRARERARRVASPRTRTRYGSSCLRSAISISMPGSACAPSTSTTRPIGCVCRPGCDDDLDGDHLARLGARRRAGLDQEVCAGCADLRRRRTRRRARRAGGRRRASVRAPALRRSAPPGARAGRSPTGGPCTRSPCSTLLHLARGRDRDRPAVVGRRGSRSRRDAPRRARA